jgi:hypothetical protein
MICEFPNCKMNAVKASKYCIGHGRMLLKVPVETKSTIPKRSDKMIEEMKQYKPLVANFLSKPENSICLIQSPVCTKKATCVNHKKRRGKNLMNEKYFEPSCGPCNNYIESHTQWALDNDHLISVHKIERV